MADDEWGSHMADDGEWGPNVFMNVKALGFSYCLRPSWDGESSGTPLPVQACFSEQSESKPDFQLHSV